MTTTDGSNDWGATARELRAVFAERATRADESDEFVADNYVQLKEAKLFSALVPKEFGGGGASHGEMCGVLREIAKGCASTALSLSMHSHLVAATVWKQKKGNGGEPLLEKVAAGELVLVSTGARDWIASNGSAKKVDGGYKVSGFKAFASGCPAGDIMITSAPCDETNEVLHFPVPLSSDGVRIEENWRTMGMRGTGSHALVLEDAFVPEAAIALRRPQGPYHPAFNMIITVAIPLIVSVYVGNAERAAEIAHERLAGRGDGPTPYLVGEMGNLLATAQLALDSMAGLVNEYDFDPELGRATAMLTRKTIAVNASLAAAEKALEAVGGAGFYRKMGLERLIRDAHAGHFHPLPEKEQQLFTGRVALGLEPM